VRGVTMTGSDGAGRHIGALASKHLKKTVLELGSAGAHEPSLGGPSLAERGALYSRFLEARKARRKDISLTPVMQGFNRQINEQFKADVTRRIEAPILSDRGFFERLSWFWADHFSARGKTGILKHANATYIEEAIRPLTTGRFSAMLAAVVTHPLMLHYLDQSSSVGPGSDVAKKNKRLKGLNENLAREVLELHTLGIDGPYDQSDVRQLAELFTGMSQTTRTGFRFKSRWAEPGSETILGKTYGGGKPSMDPIFEVLEDLALHPVTAQHLCRKLAVHFLADDPDQGLIKHMTARYLSSDGDLMQVYAAMLEHPASWEEPLRNVKPPFAFVASACRALAVRPEPLQQAAIRKIVRNFTTPLEVMGQTWLSPGGPDGWPEEDFAWINPQGLAMRMRWSMVAPENLQPQLPDPRGFHTQVLGRFSTPEIGFAAQAAETRAEGIGLTLISPAFQRR